MKSKFMACAMASVLAVSSLGMVACSGSNNSGSSNSGSSSSQTSSSDAPEQKVVKWNAGTSGNVLVTIADKKGYLADEGISIEYVEANQVSDAMTLLSTGKVDVVSNSGTSNPLQQISNGVDLTIFGGHMVEGCMPVVAKPDAEWEGIKSFIGKKVAVNPSYFAFTGAVMDLGYDKPLEVVDWEVYSSYNDALAAVIRGDVDYALLGTGLVQTAKQKQDAGEIKIVSYQSDIKQNYSCCRMEAQTKWVNDNPNTVKAILRALIRAQAYYDKNKDEAVGLLAEQIGATEDYVAAYMKDDEHYFVSVDPLKKPVEEAWDILDKTGFLKEQAKSTNIDDHINTTLYKEALDEVIAKYGSEDKEEYDKILAFYKENNE